MTYEDTDFQQYMAESGETRLLTVAVHIVACCKDYFLTKIGKQLWEIKSSY